jgi:peptide/nickel transport system permease protein
VVTLLYLFFEIFANHLISEGGITPRTVVSQWWDFLINTLTGNWGSIQVGSGFTINTAAYVGYYLPYSLELAALSLLLTSVAYPLGLLAGWRRGRALDAATQGYSAFILYVPAVLIAFLAMVYLYLPYYYYTGGDIPFGTLPGYIWFDANGGVPTWIGIYGNTSPTGFPLLDGLIHHAWGMEWIVFLKTLLCAAVISGTYTGIFLRYIRGAVSEAIPLSFRQAASARGIPERRLLWHHGGRRIIPLYAFAFGNTFGSFLFIQSIVEYMFDTNGALYLLLYQGGSQLIGGAGGTEENLLIALIFLLAVVIALVSIAAEAIAIALDPTWLTKGRRR